MKPFEVKRVAVSVRRLRASHVPSLPSSLPNSQLARIWLRPAGVSSFLLEGFGGNLASGPKPGGTIRRGPGRPRS